MLSEGKGVGQGCSSPCSALGWSSKQHPSAIPTPSPADNQTHPFTPGPRPVHTVPLGLSPPPALSPQDPGPRPGHLGMAAGWRLIEGEEGVSKKLMWFANHFCVIKTSSPSILLSHLPISGVCCLTLLPRQPAEMLPCQATDLYPKSRPPFDPPCRRSPSRRGVRGQLHSPEL